MSAARSVKFAGCSLTEEEAIEAGVREFLDRVADDLCVEAAQVAGIPTYWSESLGRFVTVPDHDDEPDLIDRMRDRVHEDKVKRGPFRAVPR